jgi:2-oxoglutarate dehydrogenase complex dehydrogenase (E1) component-like enzyme
MCRSKTSCPEQAKFCVYNSLLSEAAVLGFDYGYSLDYPQMLCHLGGAVRRLRQRRAGRHRPVHRQRRIQVAAHSGIVLLLPHGYEGQGPGALVGAARTFPPALRRGQHAGVQPHHARELLPRPAPADAPRLPQAPRGDVTQVPAAAIAENSRDAKLVWCQEEPQNMGPWSHLAPQLEEIFGRKPAYAGRDAAASPAVGALALHKLELAAFLREAFGA